MYGYFECDDCGRKWESAHTYPKTRNGTTYYKQKCENCDIYCSPYRVEATICSVCGGTARFCHCDKKSDPSKPHRSELCEKCRSGRPCQFM